MVCFFFSFVVSRVLYRLMKQCIPIYSIKWKWNCVGGGQKQLVERRPYEKEQTVSYTYLYKNLKLNFKRATESCDPGGDLILKLIDL